MNQNGYRPGNNTGYPQQNSYAQGGYPGQYFGQQGGMQNYQNGNLQAGSANAPGYNPGASGYQSQQTGEQTGYPRYFTPQGNPNASAAPGFYPAGNGYNAQTGYSQSGSNYNGQSGYQSGYSAPQGSLYQQNPITAGYSQSNPQYSMPGNGGSFIPQTPYSAGYTSPGYEPPVQNGNFQPGYNAYSQMGRQAQNTIPAENLTAQMPLNGGGYVPPPVPVRRRPFELSDQMLILIGAVLVGLFVLAVPVMASLPLKILFLALAVGFTALLWIKPLTAENKRLCFTIVAAALCIATVVSFISGGAKKNTDNTNNRASGAGITITDNAGAAAKNASGQNSGMEQPTAEPASTPAVEDENQPVIQKVTDFFKAWGENQYDAMVSLCAPSWLSKQENAKQSLFSIIQNRKPIEMSLETITGTTADTSRSITALVKLSYYNKKEASQVRMTILMKQENNDWFVDPDSLISFKKIETPDPNITPEPAKATEPPTDANTPLYYNPNGGKKYHRDPNCSSANKSILPFAGQFLYSQINDPEYIDLERCNVCNAPLRPEQQ